MPDQTTCQPSLPPLRPHVSSPSINIQHSEEIPPQTDTIRGVGGHLDPPSSESYNLGILPTSDRPYSRINAESLIGVVPDEGFLSNRDQNQESLGRVKSGTKPESAPSLLSYYTHNGRDLETTYARKMAREVEDKEKAVILRTKDVFKETRGHLLNGMCKSAIAQGESYFLPWVTLHRVLSTDNVEILLLNLMYPAEDGSSVCQKRKLGQAFVGNEPYLEQPKRLANKSAPRLEDFESLEQPKQLTNKIAPRLEDLESLDRQFRRVFATLILANQEDEIFNFLNADLDDGALRKLRLNTNPKAKGGDSRFSRLFSRWSQGDIMQFKTFQWQVAPVFFSMNKAEEEVTKATAFHDAESQGRPKTVSYEVCHPSQVLPFLDSDLPVNVEGGHGTIRFFRIHQDQQDLTRFTASTDDERNNLVAVKTLRNDTKETDPQRRAFSDEAYFVLRLQSATDTPHLGKLLSLIEVSSKPEKQDRTVYHLVFEAAERNAFDLLRSQEWWEERRNKGISDEYLTKWVAQQCYGMAEAISQFHDFQARVGDQDEKTKGMHCDIKLKNILHYEHWKQFNNKEVQTVDEKLGALQLNDFGLSTFRREASADDHLVRRFLEGDYAAPETRFLKSHTRTSDIWHLGCFFLDLAFWAVYGPKGFEEFTKRRPASNLRGDLAQFSSFVSGRNEKHTNLVINPCVLQHVTGLCNDSQSSPFIRELCHIAVNYMLVIQPMNNRGRRTQPKVGSVYNGVATVPATGNGRINAADLSIELRKCLERGSKGESGYFRKSASESFEHFESPKWKRPYLSFPCSLQDLREIAKGIHGRAPAVVARLGVNEQLRLTEEDELDSGSRSSFRNHVVTD